MDLIFHEKQEGYLCAQHCLNALLQGPYFTPVDLATLAQQMDEQERERMAENGVDSEEYRRFIEQPSGNMDDSGFFSVQVIAAALNVWNLELIPYNSSEPRALEAQEAPQSEQAFICNYRDHWFTIRRLGRQWFNLNSMLTGPQLISDTYLSVYLAQLQHEGYSIFVVFGTLPECQAHQMLLIQPAVQSTQPQAVPAVKRSQGNRLGSASDDPDLARAIQLSLGKDPQLSQAVSTESPAEDDNDDELQRVLRESVKEQRVGSPTKELQTTLKNDVENERNSDEDDLQKALRLSMQSEESGDNDFKRALQMSLECIGNESATARATSVDMAEVRARRLRYLESATSSKSSTAS